MSIKAMTHIWEHSTAKGNDLLMLLAIADHAGDDDGLAYPGVSRLAKKVRVGHRGAQKILRRLEEIGELHIETSTGLETKHGHTNRYYLVQYRKSIGITDEQRDIPSNDGVNAGSSVGVNNGTPVGVNAGSSKSSVEPSEETSALPIDEALVYFSRRIGVINRNQLYDWYSLKEDFTDDVIKRAIDITAERIAEKGLRLTNAPNYIRTIASGFEQPQATPATNGNGRKEVYVDDSVIWGEQS